MNILLLGNGYDLHYKLPTSYRNFLLTLDFLINSDIKNINNVGDVFGNSKLNEQDDFIKKSYDEYKEVYDEIELDKEKLQEMIDRTKNNVWYSYLIESFNNDVGWIDFEKEIAYVIDCFKSFFEELDVSYTDNYIRFYYSSFKDFGSRYVIMEKFNFFHNPSDVSHRWIKYKYTCEYPLKSGNFRIDKKKIIDYLYNQLKDLAEALKIYLNLFVDKTTELLCDSSSGEPKISQSEIMNHYDVVISFNYTYTYERLSLDDDLFHIHGVIDDQIVLVLNSDQDDEETIDTSFLIFKKYYQRGYYATDSSYLRWVRSLRERMKKDNNTVNGNIKLYIMGHSLDVTDEKYICELFGLATTITVFHHNETAKKQYIENLINIFGGNEFEKLRDEKQLSFVNLDYVI